MNLYLNTPKTTDIMSLNPEKLKWACTCAAQLIKKQLILQYKREALKASTHTKYDNDKKIILSINE